MFPKNTAVKTPHGFAYCEQWHVTDGEVFCQVRFPADGFELQERLWWFKASEVTEWVM